MTRPPSRPNSFPFRIVACVVVTCLIVPDITPVTPVAFGGLVVTVDIFSFPPSYIVGDVLTKVYDYDRARKVIWVGGLLPSGPVWQHRDACDAILGATPRLVLASFVAYLIGEFSNAYILARLKIATAGRHLWLRTIGSTLVGQFLDSMIFATMTFAGLVPLGPPALDRRHAMADQIGQRRRGHADPPPGRRNAEADRRP